MLTGYRDRVVIIGLGIDLVYVPSFAEQLARPGAWTDHVFTANERQDSAGAVASLAARWAAKEATIKAWSESMWGSPPVTGELVHHLIEVVSDAWGRPRIRLHGQVAESLPDAVLNVSLSHDGDYATAIVTIATATDG